MPGNVQALTGAALEVARLGEVALGDLSRHIVDVGRPLSDDEMHDWLNTNHPDVDASISVMNQAISAAFQQMRAELRGLTPRDAGNAHV